jgi:hypothetical protein
MGGEHKDVENLRQGGCLYSWQQKTRKTHCSPVDASWLVLIMAFLNKDENKDQNVSTARRAELGSSHFFSNSPQMVGNSAPVS